MNDLESELTRTPPPQENGEGGTSLAGSGGKPIAGTAGRARGSGGRTLSAGRTGSSAGEGGLPAEPEDPGSSGGTAGRAIASAGRSGAFSGGVAGVGEAAGGMSEGAAGASAGGPAAVPEIPDTLFFSEYVEGQSNNKALEISTTQPAVLDGCAIEIHLNGAASASVRVELAGELSPGAPWVVCHGKFAELERCHSTGLLSFNGNDRVRLVCADRLLDSIGTVGPAPAVSWGLGELSTYNATLRRRCEITLGDRDEQDAFDPALEWTAAGPDVFDDLGTHCLPDPEPELPAP